MVVIQFFDSEENREAAEPTFEDMPRPRAYAARGGPPPLGRKFEVLAERRLAGRPGDRSKNVADAGVAGVGGLGYGM